MCTVLIGNEIITSSEQIYHWLYQIILHEDPTKQP